MVAHVLTTVVPSSVDLSELLFMVASEETGRD